MADELSTDTPFIWVNPGAQSDRPTLIRLTPESLTLSNVPGADLEGVAEELRDGGEVAGHVIPLASIDGVKGEADGKELTVAFRTGASAQQSRVVAFADKAQRDEFAETLAGHLGPGWRHGRRPVSRLVVGSWTLAGTALVALLTWGLHAEASLIAAGKEPFQWGKGKLKLPALVVHWVEGQLGPSGVLIAGGILIGIGLLLFAILMASPPVNVVVEPVRVDEFGDAYA